MSNELFNDKKKCIIDNIYNFLSCICQQIIVELLQIYTTVQKFGVGMIFFFDFFWRKSRQRLLLFDQKYNKNSKIVK